MTRAVGMSAVAALWCAAAVLVPTCGATDVAAAATPSSGLVAVSCPAPTYCMAVGSVSPSSGATAAASLVERWDGTTWSVVPSPNPPGAVDTALTGVSCSSAVACTAVGTSSPGIGRAPLAESWDGVSWVIDPTIAPAPDAGLTAVSCTAATACVAVGAFVPYTAKALVETWDGAAWRVQKAPAPRRSNPLAVSCAAPVLCTMTGSVYPSSVFAEGWNGVAWTAETPVVPTRLVSQLTGVSCPAPSSCTAVGDDQIAIAGQGIDVSLAERWDGSAWKVEPTPDPGPLATSPRSLSAVSCPSPQRCVAVGTFGTGQRQDSLVEGWDGVHWSVEDSTALDRAGLGVELKGISCATADACTAVGIRSTAASETTIAAGWDGHRWTVEPTP